MTYADILIWINDPARTAAELRDACNGLGLPTGGNRVQRRARLRDAINAQPDLNAPAPWPPAVAPAAAPEPAAPAPEAPPASAPAGAPTATPSWLPLAALVGAAAALIMGFVALNRPNVAGTTPAPTAVTQRVLVPPAAQAPQPAGQSSSAPAPQPQASAPQTSGSEPVIIDMLDDGRSLQPRSTNVLNALGFPPYQDTGVGKTANYSLNVPDGWTAILGGVVVNGSREGNLNAYKGPTTVQANITDGFYTVKMNEDAIGEFCARLSQHVTNGWAVRFVRPLSEWGNRPCS